MTDDQAKKPPMKSSEKKFIGIVIAVFVLMLGAMIFVAPKIKHISSSANTAGASSNTEQAAKTDAVKTAAAPASAPAAAPAAPPAAAPASAAPPAAAPAAASNINIDVNAALSDRVIGDTSAPLKVSEHASLTCPHCAEFDKSTFPEFKKNFIDTKKAYLVFSDFPLNKPAMDAAMIARCLPQAKYFDFIHMLFATQDQWAYAPSYMDYLKSKAAENGLDSAHVDACLANKDLLEGMENRQKAVNAQWHVNSTPSFVINNKTVIAGAYPYDQFSKVLDDEISKMNNPNGAAAAPANSAPAKAPAPTPDKGAAGGQ